MFFAKTSTKHAPWYLIPSNHKWFRNLAISQIVADNTEDLVMKMPEPRVELKVIRTEYHETADQESQRKKNKSRKKHRKDKQKAE